MLQRKDCILFFVLLLLCAGCGGSRKKETSGQMSVYDGNLCFTEDGVVYQNPNPGSVTGYFDYKTGTYIPLCAKSNCLHDSIECQAVYLKGYADYIGRIGDKWYYHVAEWQEEEGGFHSCDLDGGNDKILGSFPCSNGTGVILFYDQMCVLATWDVEFDEDAGEVAGNTSGIYGYHLDTGEWEALCPEKETENGPAYELCGKYGENLFYSEWEGKISVLKQMNLETGEVKKPFGDTFLSSVQAADNFLLCRLAEPGGNRLIEWNLETGEQKEFPENGVHMFWSEDLKVATNFSQDFSDRRFWAYQYQEDGTCELIRQGELDEVFRPVAKSGSLLLGQMWGKNGGFTILACMEQEDYLAGKTNWTIVTEEK